MDHNSWVRTVTSIAPGQLVYTYRLHGCICTCAVLSEWCGTILQATTRLYEPLPSRCRTRKSDNINQVGIPNKISASHASVAEIERTPDETPQLDITTCGNDTSPDPFDCNELDLNVFQYTVNHIRCDPHCIETHFFTSSSMSNDSLDMPEEVKNCNPKSDGTNTPPKTIRSSCLRTYCRAVSRGTGTVCNDNMPQNSDAARTTNATPTTVPLEKGGEGDMDWKHGSWTQY